MPPGVTTASGQVQLFDGSTLLGTATLANSVATLTTSALVPGSHTITAVYAGDANLQGSTGSTAETILPSDFALTADPPKITIQTEHNGALTLTVDASSGGFSGPVTLTCAAPLSAFVTCELPKTPVIVPAGGKAQVRFEMDTDAVLNSWGPGNGDDPHTTWAWVGIGMLTLLGLSRRRSSFRRSQLVVLVLCSLFGVSGCGGLWPAHTPPGVYTVQVVATGQTGSATLQHTLDVMLTVTP